MLKKQGNYKYLYDILLQLDKMQYQTSPYTKRAAQTLAVNYQQQKFKLPQISLKVDMLQDTRKVVGNHSHQIIINSGDTTAVTASKIPSVATIGFKKVNPHQLQLSHLYQSPRQQYNQQSPLHQHLLGKKAQRYGSKDTLHKKLAFLTSSNNDQARSQRIQQHRSIKTIDNVLSEQQIDMMNLLKTQEPNAKQIDQIPSMNLLQENKQKYRNLQDLSVTHDASYISKSHIRSPSNPTLNPNLNQQLSQAEISNDVFPDVSPTGINIGQILQKFKDKANRDQQPKRDKKTFLFSKQKIAMTEKDQTPMSEKELMITQVANSYFTKQQSPKPKLNSKLSARSNHNLYSQSVTSRGSNSYRSSSESSYNSRGSKREDKDIGEGALKDYQEFFNNGRRMAEKQELRGEQVTNPLLSYLNEVDKNHRAPKGFGLVHRKKKDEINLTSFYLRESYVDAFSIGLNLSTKVLKLNLSRNQLTTNRLIKIVMKVPNTLRELNLSNNPALSIEAFKTIGEYLLENPIMKLERLSLEGCKINDQGATVIARAVEYNLTLRFLDLSKNDIREQGAKELAQLFLSNNILSVVFLHWNPLQPKGGSYIAKALSKNQSIQIMDLSYCSMGGSRENQEKAYERELKKALDPQQHSKSPAVKDGDKSPTLNKSNINQQSFMNLANARTSPRQQLALNLQYAQEWKDMFFYNKKMAHLDLTSNGFCAQEVEIMGEGLKENHTILGLHMVGNEAKTDALGFIVPIYGSETNHEEKQHVFTRIKPTLEMGSIKSKAYLKLQATSNCWICEGWTEFKFTFNPPPSDQILDADTTPIMLHVSCDKFLGELLDKDPIEPQQYTTTRMLPPGEITYYYSVNGIPTVAEDQVTQVSEWTEKSRKLIKLQVPKTNIIDNVIQTQQLLTQTYLTNMQCIPRPEPKNLKGREKLKTPWDFFKSVFRDYKPDTEQLLEECFEYDWSCSKIEKIVKGEEEIAKCKEYLRHQYKYIRETYKYYSAVDPSGLICSIGTNVYSEIISNCKDFVDGKTFKISDLDLEFVATNAGIKKSNPRNPERALVRYQLMEVLVRLAIDKFIKSGQTKSFFEAIQLSFENHFLPFFKQFDCHRFRRERLWNEECDIMFKRWYKVVLALYAKYSGKYALPGQQKYMSLDEFMDMVMSCGVLDESFGAREIGPLFNLSMMTQKNELDSERHYNMMPPEFIEAIGRVADKINNMGDYFPETVSQNKFKVDKKIESFMLILMRNCLPKAAGEVLEKQIRKVYEEELSQPKATKYEISDRKY